MHPVALNRSRLAPWERGPNGRQEGLEADTRDVIAGAGRITIATVNVVLDAAFCATHSDLAPGPHARLTFGDDGSGMTREVRARLFEPFFTA